MVYIFQKVHKNKPQMKRPSLPITSNKYTGAERFTFWCKDQRKTWSFLKIMIFDSCQHFVEYVNTLNMLITYQART